MLIINKVNMKKNNSLTNQNVEDFTSVCRSCLSSASTLLDMFRASLQEAFESCTSVKIHQDDDLPAKLCVKCISLLNQCYIFKKRTLKSDALLKKIKKEGKKQSDKGDTDNVIVVKHEDLGIPSSPSDPADWGFIPKTEYDSCQNDKEVIDSNNKHRNILFIEEKQVFSDGLDDEEESDQALSNLKQSLGSVIYTTESENVKATKKESIKKIKKIGELKKQAEDITIIRKPRREKRPKRQRMGVYRCKACDVTFTSCSLRQKHCYKEHPPEKNFRCEKCAQGFISFASLEIHLISHCNYKPYQCDHCKKYFKSKFGVQGHMRKHNSFYQKKFMCTVCGKQLYSSKELKCHMQSHSEDRPLQCSQCPKQFKNTSNLTSHKKTHSLERPHRCSLCTKAFKTLYDCKKHISLHGKSKKLCP